MPKLIIDGLEIEVQRGTKVIKAAEQLGIMIPHFCYHEGLGSVGACRMCAVKFAEGPVKGVQMSCMVDAQDGMAVSTTDEEAVEFRRYVVELLMRSHPHDCPVCDEGGHCLLQDETVSGGHGIRRYLGKKRTYYDQYLGTLVQHEMNRCIHCYRCVRFYQEFAGYRDYGVMQIASRTYFGRQADGPLESPFSGNIIDLCPTGVLTDRPSRFAGRRWHYERAPSLCIHCSLGCSTVASTQYREVVRLEGRFNEEVNGFFICDRGRYGFPYTNIKERHREARVGVETASSAQAIQAARERLAKIEKSAGPGAIAALSSARTSIETQAMLLRLCKDRGWHGPTYFLDPALERKLGSAVSRLDGRLMVSMRDVEHSDCILVIGADPVNEAPMLALAIRQARRRDGDVIVIDPRPVSLPCTFDHLAVAPEDIDLCLSVLVKGALGRSVAAALGPKALAFYDSIPAEYPFPTTLKDRIRGLVSLLEKSTNPVIVCGTDIVGEATPGLAADNALLLQAAKGKAGLFYVLPGPNAFGSAVLSPPARLTGHLLEAIEQGAIKALVLVEADPFKLFPDRRMVEHALDRLELLVVLDYVPSWAAGHASLLIPTSTVFETRAGFVNQEGRIQFTGPAHCGGTPIALVSGGRHPPRVFGTEIPGGDHRPAWQILADLYSTMSMEAEITSYEDMWAWIRAEIPLFADMEPFDKRHPHGLRLTPGPGSADPFSLNGTGQREQGRGLDHRLKLLLVDWTFGTEELSHYSQYLHKVEKEPCLFLHPEDAARLGLAHGAAVVIELDRGPLEARLCLAENMASGVMVLPRHRRLAWQKLDVYPMIVPTSRIRRV